MPTASRRYIQLMWQKIRRQFWPEKTLRDDFVARIRCAVAGEGMLAEGNIFCFDYAIRHLPLKGTALEIGSFGGMSTNVIAALLRKHGEQRPFFTCDPWHYEGFYDKIRSGDVHYMNHVDGSDSITRAEYTDFIRDSFVRSTRFFSRDVLPHTLQMASDDFFEAWSKRENHQDIFGNRAQLGGPLAFCYVDGNHEYEQARRDAENALEFLVPGGWLLLDDSADHLPFGSVRVARELCRRTDLKLVLKNPNYLFQKIE